MIPILIWALAAAPCHPVSGDRILGRDLAAASTAFAAVAPDWMVGFAPQPGGRRLLDAGELSRIARANGVDDPGVTSLCFERATAPLDPTAVLAAMRESLGLLDARVEIVELSKYTAPAGKIVFPREALTEPSGNEPAVWNGYVAYDGGHFPIWAHLRVAVRQRRLVAVVDLRPSQLVRSGDVRVEEGDDFPRRTQALSTVEAAVGRVPRRLIPAGSAVIAAALEAGYEVSRGETVHVEVRSGKAVLNLEAKAEIAGRRGDTIPMRNLSSGKPFRGRIVGAGRVLVECPSSETSE